MSEPRSPRPLVGLLYGGRSAEHDVSRRSAANVLRALDPARWEALAIAVGRDGVWRLPGARVWGDDPAELAAPEDAPACVLVPGGGGLLLAADPDGAWRPAPRRLDAVFPVLHGPMGEDGTVQGLLELAGVAYVGSGVLGSAVGMDKHAAKRLMRQAGLPVLPALAVAADDPWPSLAAAADAVGAADLFVKPANMGSSVGVSRARSEAELQAALALAFRYDRLALAERAVPGAREIECALLQRSDGSWAASGLGEIVPDARHGFYSYAAKYLDAEGALLRVPADLSPAAAARARDLALAAVAVLGCAGLARVDLFLDPADPEGLYVNEVNTLPGFTQISMYPKLWEAAGLSQPDLMDALLAHAVARRAARSSLEVARD